MADVIVQMLTTGQVSVEQCESILRGFRGQSKVVGESTSEITPQRSTTGIVEIDDPSRPPFTLRQLLDHRTYISDEVFFRCDRGPQELDKEYVRQVKEYEAFDFEVDVCIPRLSGLSPFYFQENNKEQQPPLEFVFYARLGVHGFNFLEDRNLQYKGLPKLTSHHPIPGPYFITVDVKDVDDGSSLTLQTIAARPYFPELLVCIEGGRIKPSNRAEITRRVRLPLATMSYWYKTHDVPITLSYLAEPPEADDPRFHELTEQEINDFDWLRLYTDFSLFHVWEEEKHGSDDSFVTRETQIKKVIVETKQDVDEPFEKVKYKDVLFHIRFTANSCDYTSVLRRCSDHGSGNIFFQVNCHKQTSPA